MTKPPPCLKRRSLSVWVRKVTKIGQVWRNNSIAFIYWYVGGFKEFPFAIASTFIHDFPMKARASHGSAAYKKLETNIVSPVGIDMWYNLECLFPFSEFCCVHGFKSVKISFWYRRMFVILLNLCNLQTSEQQSWYSYRLFDFCSLECSWFFDLIEFLGSSTTQDTSAADSMNEGDRLAVFTRRFKSVKAKLTFVSFCWTFH